MPVMYLSALNEMAKESPMLSPPIAFAEKVGLLTGEYPLAAFKFEGIAADPCAISRTTSERKADA